MAQTIIVSNAAQLRVNETFQVECLGVPFVLTMTERGEPRAFVNVCPHDWIEMNPCRVKHGCLECHKHDVTFDLNTGEVRDSKGKNISRGLCPAKAEISNGTVAITIDESHFEFFRQYRLRATVRKLKRLFRRGH